VSKSLWSSLVQYYRSCLGREQELSLRAPADPAGYVILREIDEHLISRRATTTILSEPRHTNPILVYLNRRGRGIGGTFIYGYPVARDGESLVPLAYTEVRLEPGTAPRTVVLTRGNAELLINRRFLRQTAGLTDAEVSSLLMGLRSPRYRGLQELLGQYLLDVDVRYDAILFAADTSSTLRGPGRELQLMEQLKRDRLPDTIRIFIGELAIPSAPRVAHPLTIAPADPVQMEALRRRRSAFVVVSGPDGSGKTQTALNLIAGAVADGQKVLYISRDPEAVAAVRAGLAPHFPGIMQIGGRDAWMAALAYARQVIEAVQRSEPGAEPDPAVETASQRLEEELDRLEGEASELMRVQHELRELERTRPELEARFEGHPHREWAEALAARIGPEAAAHIHADQQAGLRELLAQASRWETEGGALGGLFRDRARIGQIKSILRSLNLPECCHPEGDLQEQLEWLGRLEEVFPLVAHRARMRCLTDQRDRRPPLESIRAELARLWPAKVAADQQRLKWRWAALAERIRPSCERLLKVIDQEEKELRSPGAVRGSALRRQRFAELLEAFPAVLSPTFTIAGIIPNEPELFDLLVVDDASLADIPSFLPVLYRTRRACILGDESRPREWTWLGEDEDNRLLGQVEGYNLAAFAYADRSVLDRALQVAQQQVVLRLSRQHVLPADVAEWCGAQAEGHAAHAMRRGTGGLEYEVVPDGEIIYPAPEAISQAQNPIEAREALRLVTQFIAQGETDVALLTPFRGQAILLSSLLERLSEMEADPGRAEALRQVQVSTSGNLPRRSAVAILSMVVAPGATEETYQWLEQRKLHLVRMVSAAERVVLLGHRESLRAGGEWLRGLLERADGSGD